MTEKHPCGDLFISIGNEIYKSTVFNRFFEKNDPIVMGWAENVLAKLTAEGILPAFLQKKDNEDFKAYWGTIAHVFALAVVYARKYKEIDSNKILFETFIQNKGLTTDLVDSQEQMEYLFYNYLTEYSKRGRLDIVSTEGAVLGELLRLIRYNSTDEFIFALLQPQNTGWVMGSSSPSWKRTNTIENITKAYEFSESITDLNKYPLLRSASIQLVSDKDQDNELVQVMSFSGNQAVGIQGSPSQKDKYILIDPSISYEISLKIKINGLENQNLKFGAAGFDINFNQVNFSVLSGTEYQSESNWFHSNNFLNLREKNIYYEIKGILLANNQRYLTAPVLNFLSGRALSMKAEMKYIYPVFIQERSASSDPLVYLYDLKVKPLELPFEQGYLGARDIIASYYKNNAFQKESTLNLFLKKYLLSYKNIFNGKVFTPLEQGKLTFKVFSNRNKYLPNAIISINGKSYQTNTNGEVSMDLYPGSYSYDVEAENFNSIGGNILEMDNSNKVEYVQMIGAVYQRSVVFSVRSNNAPLEGAKVTFNGQINFTGANGLAFFEAFPGIYEYKVEKTDYTTVSRNVSIVEDTTIDVDLQAIPYYKVSFRVRDMEVPVAEAAVILTGDFDGDGKITEQTGSTNALGIVSGFVMRAGTYQYRISKEGYITQEQPFSIVGNATIEIALAPVPKRNVTFIVKSSALPIAGVTVTFNGKQVLTDAFGKAVFKEPNGEYHYSVAKKEFTTQSGAITVQDEDVVKNIELVQIGYVLTIKVKYEVLILKGATVTVGTETITAGDYGIAEFIRINGSYNWKVSYPGYYDATGVVMINGESKTVNVEMNPIRFNLILITRINGQIAPYIAVKIDGSDMGFTNAEGIFKSAFWQGTYTYAVEKAGYDVQSGSFQIVDRDVTVNVDLAATKGTVILTAKDSETQALLNGVAVTVNGETKYTAPTGQVSFTLVLGIYNYVSALNGYNSNTGSFEVTEGSTEKEILMVKIAAKVWGLTFILTEEGVRVQGASVQLSDGQYGYSDFDGIVRFTLVSGTYSYHAESNIMCFPIDGSTTVPEADTVVSLNFLRKTATVTFIVRDSLTDLFVKDVSIDFANSSRSTNLLGEAIFTGVKMTREGLRYIASKNPPYQDLIGSTAVLEENLLVELKMGQYSYNIIFTVKDSNGAIIQEAYVVCNGKAGYTNEKGQVTLLGYVNGTYSYTVTHKAYQTATGNTTVANADAYPNVVMQPINNTIKYHVQYSDGTPISGISVTVNNNTMATNSNGDAIFTLTVGTYKYNIGKGSYYINLNGDLTVTGGDQVITKILEDVFVVSTTGGNLEPTNLPIKNTASQNLSQVKVDWGDGIITTGVTSHQYSVSAPQIIKISPGETGGTLYWGYGESASRANNLTGILQWFQKVSTINLLPYAFSNNAYLSQIAPIKGSQLKGTLRGIFNQCPNLTSLPTGFFQWSHDNDLGFAFRNTGFSGNISQDFFNGISSIIKFEYAFSESKINSFTAKVPFSQSSNVDATGAFKNCSSLASCSAFENLRGAANLSYAFSGDGALSKWPPLGGGNGAVDMIAAFENCSGLPGLTISNYLPRGARDCTGIFSYCFKITAFASGLIPATVTNLNRAFYGCKALADISGTKVPAYSTALVSMIETYKASGVRTIPDLFFQGLSGVQSFKGAFQDCRSLTRIGSDIQSSPEIFMECKAVDMSYCFSECESLSQGKYGLVHLFTASAMNPGVQCILKYCTNYSNCFSGCSKIIDFPRVFTTAGSIPLQLWQSVGVSIYDTQGRFLFTAPSSTGSGCFNGCSSYYIGLNNIPASWK